MRGPRKRSARCDVRDPKAVEILQSLDYDFSHLRRLWMLQVDIAVRTEIIDEATCGFLAREPEAMVINLGAGLDGRFWRLDNGRLDWVDLDFPDVITLRRRFYEQSDRNRFIRGRSSISPGSTTCDAGADNRC